MGKIDKFILTGIVVGLVMILLSLYIFYFISHPFLLDVSQEVFSIGLGFLLVSLIFKFIRVKLA